MGREPRSAKARVEETKHLRRLGTRLKELREAKQLTPQDLADKLGVTPQYIYMIESGKARPTEKRLNELAIALGDLADDFLSTALEHVEEEFAERLREAGLSPAEIEEAARRVSARARENVVSGREPLRIARGQASEDQIVGAFENREDIVAMDAKTSSLREPPSAVDYARSITEQFELARLRPEAEAGSVLAGKSNNQVSRTIHAGPDARIIVDRPISHKEAKALEDLGRVIEHLLNT